MSFHRLNLRVCQFPEVRSHYVNTTKHAAHMKSFIWLDKPNQKTALATPTILLCTLQSIQSITTRGLLVDVQKREARS